MTPQIFGNGIVADLSRSGRPRISTEDVQRIENEFYDNPRLLTRNAERDLKIPISTIRDVLKKKLNMLPYKISFLHQLLPDDNIERLLRAQYCGSKMRDDLEKLSRISFSNECLFHMNRTVKEHNARIWRSENPKTVQEVPIRYEKSTKKSGHIFFVCHQSTR